MEEEITHHQQHSSSSNNKLEEPTTPPVVVVVVEVEKEEEVVVTDDDFDPVVVAEMEKILNYRFRNKNLLNDALTRWVKTITQRRTTSLSERIQFQRQEFLGDAALGLAVASFIFINLPDVDDSNNRFPGIFMRNISNEKFACVAIQHGFYRYLRCPLDLHEYTQIRNFALVVQEAMDGVLSSQAVKAPKFLADLVESIAGAIFVDCDFDLKLFWKCFGGLLEPCITPTSLYLPEIYRLFSHCKKARKQVNVRYWRQGSQNIAAVYVNRHFLCSSYSEEERIAKVNAASEALKLLSSTSDDHNSRLRNHVEVARPICFKFRVEKEDSEDKAIKEKLEEKRNQLVETKKRKRETGSEVSAEKVERDMAIDEKLEKKRNKLVETKKRKMENGSEVSADKVKVDIAINKKLEKKTKKESGGVVRAEKVEQLFAEDKKIPIAEDIIAEVEEILGYRFRNKSLLEEALTHSSYSSSTPNYERRLDFIGGIVLSLAVSNFLFINYPDLGPDQLSQLRGANIKIEKLACATVRHGFYKYLRCNSPVLDAKVRDFVLVIQEGDEVAIDGVMRAPVILAEIVRSIVAAIFVDCEFDFKLLWKYFCGLLEPLITLDTYQQHPAYLLNKLCRKERKHVDVKDSYNGSQFTVSYNVNGQLVGSGCSKFKFIANAIAAREALKLWNFDSSESLPMDVDVVVGIGPEQKLNELCIKNGWQMPTYKVKKEGTPPDIKYICKVQIETVPGSYLTATGLRKRRSKASVLSAAFMMVHDLENSEHVLVKSP